MNTTIDPGKTAQAVALAKLLKPSASFGPGESVADFSPELKVVESLGERIRRRLEKLSVASASFIGEPSQEGIPSHLSKMRESLKFAQDKVAPFLQAMRDLNEAVRGDNNGLFTQIVSFIMGNQGKIDESQLPRELHMENLAGVTG